MLPNDPSLFVSFVHSHCFIFLDSRNLILLPPLCLLLVEICGFGEVRIVVKLTNWFFWCFSMGCFNYIPFALHFLTVEIPMLKFYTWINYCFFKCIHLKSCFKHVMYICVVVDGWNHSCLLSFGCLCRIELGSFLLWFVSCCLLYYFLFVRPL